MPQFYPLLKALHVAAALLFVGGLLASSVVLISLRMIPDRAAGPVAVFTKYDRSITLPAMLIVWAFGIALASSGSWFSYGWLQVKIVIVILLSALHGIQSGQIQKLAAGSDVGAVRSIPFIVLAAIAITVLVVMKP